MNRKVFKTGNSLVVSLPKDLLESLSLQDGSDVSVELDRKNRQILIRPAELPLAGDLTRISGVPVPERGKNAGFSIAVAMPEDIRKVQ